MYFKHHMKAKQNNKQQNYKLNFQNCKKLYNHINQ